MFTLIDSSKGISSTWMVPRDAKQLVQPDSKDLKVAAVMAGIWVTIYFFHLVALHQHWTRECCWLPHVCFKRTATILCEHHTSMVKLFGNASESVTVTLLRLKKGPGSVD